MPNNQVNVAELNRRDASSAPLRLLRLMRDLEVFADELCNAEETIGQPVWTYQDPLVERLRRVGSEPVLTLPRIIRPKNVER